MAPVVLELRRREAGNVHLESVVYVTAQHREMLDQVLELFDITPDVDLDLMQPKQELADLSARMLTALSDLFRSEAPDLVLVHGDTTTAKCAGPATGAAGARGCA